MGDLLGEASIYPFIQMTGSTRKHRVTAAQSRDSYLPAADRLRLPVTFIHGSDNGVFGAGSTRKTYELLCETHGPELYRRHVVDGYGHMDCLIGDHGARDVFPHIVEHLERVEQLERAGEARRTPQPAIAPAKPRELRCG